MPELFRALIEALISAKVDTVRELTQSALTEGIDAKNVLMQGLIPGMDIVGQKMKAGELFVPEVLCSAMAMHAALDLLKPFLSEMDKTSTGTILIGTAEGDLHDIGKNLVCMMLEGAGFKVIDLGVNISPRAFIAAIKDHKPDILGISTLLTTTMPKMRETIHAIREAGMEGHIKIMIGGAPVTQDFADEIGADAYGSDAAEAVEKAKMLVLKNLPKLLISGLP